MVPNLGPTRGTITTPKPISGRHSESKGETFYPHVMTHGSFLTTLPVHKPFLTTRQSSYRTTTRGKGVNSHRTTREPRTKGPNSGPWRRGSVGSVHGFSKRRKERRGHRLLWADTSRLLLRFVYEPTDPSRPRVNHGQLPTGTRSSSTQEGVAGVLS